MYNRSTKKCIRNPFTARPHRDAVITDRRYVILCTDLADSMVACPIILVVGDNAQLKLKE